MSSLDDSQGIGGGNAGDDNPFSLPESDFVDDASNNETAGQRVGLGYADAASEQGSADEAGLQAEQPDSSDSGNADLKHDVAPSSGRTDSTDSDTCDDKDTSGAHRTSNARSNGSGQQEERAYSSPAQQSDSQPSPENSTPDQVEEQAKLPLDRVIQRGEQIGAGRDPMTGKPDTDRKTWTEADKQAAWDNADIVPGEDKTKVRQDAKGDVMHRDDYGKNKTSVGPLNLYKTSICSYKQPLFSGLFEAISRRLVPKMRPTQKLFVAFLAQVSMLAQTLRGLHRSLA